MNNDDLLASLFEDALPELGDLELPQFELDDLPTEQDSTADNENNRVDIKRDGNNIQADIKKAETLTESLKSKDKDFLQKSIKELIRFYTSIENNEINNSENINADLSVLKSLDPKDELEVIQIKQILMMHTIIIKFLVSAIDSKQTGSGKEINVNRATKLIRVFNSSIQTLIKYSRGGHQKVTVQHLNVSDGGKAVVGEINSKRGGENFNEPF